VPPGGGWQPRRGGGLGTAALVLGIISLFLLFLCGVGVLTAVAGLIVGIIAVVKGSNRGRAWVGIGLSALALVLAVVAVTWFYTTFEECLRLPTQEQAQKCVERKLNMQGTS
jgi:membrane protein implicated in regulation of membrane protease activity